MKNKINILVLGASGQLGQCVKDALDKVIENGAYVTYTLADHTTVDIADEEQVRACVEKQQYDTIINCAAYTNVAGAETDKEAAMKCNEFAVGVLAKICAEYNIKLIHISTDYVFDGTNDVKYEDSLPHPINVYGASKLLGETAIIREAQKTNLEYMIIRTSWLYSEYGNNFVKTIIKKLEAKENMNIIYDQVGSPTYAGDLAKFIVDDVLLSGIEFVSGIYNYSNQGVISWYDFAMAICEIFNEVIISHKGYVAKIDYNVNPITTDSFKSNVDRPRVGILPKDKVISTYKARVPYWKDSLKDAIVKIYQQK